MINLFSFKLNFIHTPLLKTFKTFGYFTKKTIYSFNELRKAKIKILCFEQVCHFKINISIV